MAFWLFIHRHGSTAFSPVLQEILRTRSYVCMFCHATYAFQNESTPYSCLNVKELLARSKRGIWSLSDCNWTRTQNHVVRKRTIWPNWPSIVVKQAVRPYLVIRAWMFFSVLLISSLWVGYALTVVSSKFHLAYILKDTCTRVENLHITRSWPSKIVRGSKSAFFWKTFPLASFVRRLHQGRKI